MRHGRRDSTHKAIVAELRDLGATVYDAGDVGGGFPDLVVGLCGRTYLVECKTETGKLTPDQDDFIAEWKGSPVVIIRSASQAANWLLEQRRRRSEREREDIRAEPAQDT